MPIDAWFPLVVYYADLEGSAAQKAEMMQRIEMLHQLADAQRTSKDAAWTGDVHNAERIHFDPAFDWITGQVAIHAREYLKKLAHDLGKIDIFIQRAWPIISRKGQHVLRHSHHNAHLSAVYYVSVPKPLQEASGGELVFYNEAKQNEVSGGLGTDMTGAYKELNFANFQSAIYKPIEGRLLFFPAKQSHAVEAHDADEPRISLSYDLVITSREDQSPGLHEFLMPPPSQWKRLPREEEEAARLEQAKAKFPGTPFMRWPNYEVSYRT
jgi:uncharacterized protein (TIGR02466 family)